MPRFYFKLENEKEFINKMKKVDTSIKQVLQDAVNEGAKYLMEQIKQNAPVNDKDAVHIKENMLVKEVKKRSNVKVASMVVIGNKEAPYPMHLETGHVIKGDNGVMHVPAKPFIRPTVDSTANEVADIVLKKISDSIGAVL